MSNLELFTHLHFLRPHWFVLLLPLGVLIYLNWRSSAAKQSWQKVIPAHLAQALQVGDHGWTQQLPLKLLTILCLVIVFILAGPSFYKQPSPFSEDAAPLIIVLDSSESMLQRDVAPNRLKFAKQKITDLIATRDQGHTALIVYSGSAHVAMPLTQDKQVFQPILDAVSPDILPTEGKFAEYTLVLIDKILSQSAAPGSALLLTDGISDQGLAAYADYFSAAPHQLLVMGVGDSAVAVDVPAELDKLQQLAKAAGGNYTGVSINDRDVVWVAEHIKQHMRLNPETTTPWADAGYFLAFFIAGLYLLWFRKGWLVKWGFVLVVMPLSVFSTNTSAQEWRFADLWLTADQQGRYYFEQQDYATAAQRFNDPQWKAMAYYQAGEFKLAQQFFMRTNSLDAKFGAATAFANQKAYYAARDLYHEVLTKDPDYPGAQHNLALMEAVIAQLEAMPGSPFGQKKLNENQENANPQSDDKPKTAAGSQDKLQEAELFEQQLTAEAILYDAKANEKWMKRVDSRLDRFLMKKFELQMKQGLATQEYSGNG